MAAPTMPSRPPSQPQQLSFAARAAAASASAGPRSRFHEGSMNDRVSAAPPAAFLGVSATDDDDDDEDSPELYAQRPAAAPRLGFDRRSGSISSDGTGNSKSSGKSRKRGSVQSNGSASAGNKRSGFFAVWDGVREKLGLGGLGRAKSSFNLGGRATRPQQQQQDQQHRQPHHAVSYSCGLGSASAPNTPLFPSFEAAGADGTGRPNRDEVLQSYQQLMKSGFFDAHAIRSTRHAPPGAGGAAMARTQSNIVPGNDYARNYANTNRPDSSEGRMTALSPPPVRHTTQNQSRPRSQHGPRKIPSIITTTAQEPPSSSPFRGTKRGHHEEEDAAAAHAASTPARRLVKKLRKSTSRVAGSASVPTSAAASTTTLASPVAEDVPFVPVSAARLVPHKKLTKPSSRRNLDAATVEEKLGRHQQHQQQRSLRGRKQRRAEQSAEVVVLGDDERERRRRPSPSPRRRVAAASVPPNPRRVASPRHPQRGYLSPATAEGGNTRRTASPSPARYRNHATTMGSRQPDVPSFHYPQRVRRPRQTNEDQPLSVSPAGGNRRAARRASGHKGAVGVGVVEVGVDVENRI